MITVNCQSSIKVTGNNVVVYFDPLNVDEQHDADVIFITHSHWDHYSPDDIVRVKRDDTVIVVPADLADQVTTLGFVDDKVVIVKPGQNLTTCGLPVRTVPAYNLTKSFHPQANNWVGYVVVIDDTTYYIMGDTDALAENETIKCDVLCIPIGGTYTMDAIEAAEFTNKLRPKTVVPIHYGMVVGSHDDFVKFQGLINKDIIVSEKIAL